MRLDSVKFNRPVKTLAAVCFLAFSLIGPSSFAQVPAHAIKPQVLIDRAMAIAQSGNDQVVSKWIKVLPVLAYQIPTDPKLVPEIIRNNVGTIDQVNKYQPEDQKYQNIDDFFIRNAGGVLNLAVTEGRIDIYHIGNETWTNKYVKLPASDVFKANPKLIKQLKAIEGFSELVSLENSSLVGGLKNVTIPLVKLSDLGFSRDQELVLDKSEDWGPNQVQVAQAGDDAYMALEIKIDKATGQVTDRKAYIINLEGAVLPNGTIEQRPIAYIPFEEFAKLPAGGPNAIQPTINQRQQCDSLLTSGSSAPKLGLVHSVNSETLTNYLNGKIK